MNDIKSVDGLLTCHEGHWFREHNLIQFINMSYPEAPMTYLRRNDDGFLEEINSCDMPDNEIDEAKYAKLVAIHEDNELCITEENRNQKMFFLNHNKEPISAQEAIFGKDPQMKIVDQWSIQMEKTMDALFNSIEMDKPPAVADTFIDPKNDQLAVNLRVITEKEVKQSIHYQAALQRIAKFETKIHSQRMVINRLQDSLDEKTRDNKKIFRSNMEMGCNLQMIWESMSKMVYTWKKRYARKWKGLSSEEFDQEFEKLFYTFCEMYCHCDPKSINAEEEYEDHISR